MINYLIATNPLPPIQPGILYEYILAGNGVFVRAARAGLEVMIPISNTSVRGLPAVEPYMKLSESKVPRLTLEYILQEALNQHKAPGVCRVCGCTDENGCPEGCYWIEADLCSQCAPDHETALSIPTDLVEVMFYLDKEFGGWRLWQPEQIQSGVAIEYKPENSLIELHSHHSMGAFFSTTDNADQQGFRIYAVLGRITTTPTLHVRVGVYGHFWKVPAEWVFDLPENVRDIDDPKEDEEVVWEWI